MSHNTPLTITTTTNHQPTWKGAAHMKHITRSKIYLPMAAMILTLALAVPAAAQNRVPFKGTMQGYDIDSPGPSPTTVVVSTSGTGIGTLLGQFSFTQQVTVDFTTGTSTGSAHWVAANGDSIDMTVTGSGEPMATPDGVVFVITETYFITGGTGRFAGAQGSFTMERVGIGAPQFITFGSFHGSITSPGAAH
jgi:hypothetical protein